MDPDELINAICFYLRHLRRLSRDQRALLSGAVEAALWEQAEHAANRLRRLAELEPVPVPFKRHPNQPRLAG